MKIFISYLKTFFHYFFLILSVYNEMYQEAVSLVQECKDRKIPLSKLRRSTLAVLHDFCLRESHTSGQVPKFSVSIEVIMI